MCGVPRRIGNAWQNRGRRGLTRGAAPERHLSLIGLSETHVLSYWHGTNVFGPLVAIPPADYLRIMTVGGMVEDVDIVPPTARSLRFRGYDLLAHAPPRMGSVAHRLRRRASFRAQRYRPAVATLLSGFRWCGGDQTCLLASSCHRLASVRGASSSSDVAVELVDRDVGD